MRIEFYRGVKIAAITASAMALPILFPAGSAAATPIFSHSIQMGQAVQLRLPPGAGKGVASELTAVDCVSASRAGWCLAGGGYSGPNYASHAMIATESGGRWGRASEVRLPAVARQAAIAGVDCTAVRSCVAVGDYLTDSGYFSFSVTESAGHWGRAQIIPPPIGGGFPNIRAISCSAPGDCEAVGSYLKGQDNQPITATESHGIWSRERVLRRPANGTDGALLSVSCPRSGLCVAVGHYDFGIAGSGVMVAVESHGKWQRAHAIELPAGAQPGPFEPDLGSLSCTRTGSCTAVGSYENAGGHEVPMAATLTAEPRLRLTRARAVNALPANGKRGPDAAFGAVSCVQAGPGSCLALGSYHTKSGKPQTMLVTLAPGKRPTASEIQLPANALAGGQFNSRFEFDGALDCPLMRFCAAVGTYKPRSGLFQAWAATTWQARGTRLAVRLAS